MFRLLLIVVLIGLVPAADAPACTFGDTPLTTLSLALSAPSYTLWTTAPARYELQAPDTDLQSGTLEARTPLAIASAGTVGLFVRMAEPSTLYLCPDGARPTFVFLPMVQH